MRYKSWVNKPVWTVFPAHISDSESNLCQITLTIHKHWHKCGGHIGNDHVIVPLLFTSVTNINAASKWTLSIHLFASYWITTMLRLMIYIIRAMQIIVSLCISNLGTDTETEIPSDLYLLYLPISGSISLSWSDSHDQFSTWSSLHCNLATLCLCNNSSACKIKKQILNPTFWTTSWWWWPEWVYFPLAIHWDVKTCFWSAVSSMHVAIQAAQSLQLLQPVCILSLRHGHQHLKKKKKIISCSWGTYSKGTTGDMPLIHHNAYISSKETSTMAKVSQRSLNGQKTLIILLLSNKDTINLILWTLVKAMSLYCRPHGRRYALNTQPLLLPGVNVATVDTQSMH